MVETTVVRTIRVKGTSEGIEKLTGDLTKLAGAQENVAVVSEQTAKRTLSVQDAWKRQTMQVDESARSQARIARETKVADAALRENLISQQQHAERLELIGQRYGVAAQATQKFGTQTGLARHELVNLGRQAQDVGVSLVSGQSPLMVLAQQGTQIADIFATSGGTVRGFFSQAIGWAGRFFTSTAGIVSSIAAIGAAAVYAAYQLTSSSTTVKEALEEENRLLKEGKALIDAKASAAEKAAAQPKDQTRFEVLRNEIDLRLKLNAAMQEAIQLGQRRSMTPSQVPGEMGEAPTAFAPSGVPGLAEMAAAVQRLQAALQAGLPGIKDFNAELGRIGLAHPELAKTVEQMLKLTAEGLQLEQAAIRAKDMKDALAGTATEAQKAALGLGNVNAEADRMLQNLQMQGELARAASEEERGRIVAAREYNRLLEKGVDAQKAGAIAAQMQANARESAYSREMARAESEAADATERSAQATREMARAAAQSIAAWNVIVEKNRQIYDYAKYVPFALREAGQAAAQIGSELFESKSGQLTQFRPEGYTSSTLTPAGQFALNTYGQGGYDPNTGAPNAQGIANLVNTYLSGGRSMATRNWMAGGGVAGAIEGLLGGGATPEALQVVQQLTQLLPKEQQAGVIERELALLRAQPQTIEREQMIQQLTQTLDQLRQSTDNLNGTMQQVLSEYYTSDPRTSHLGFRTFAQGGIMTAQGEVPLKTYQLGGIVRTPQVAIYGEGSTPEAIVPIPNGHIPVRIMGAANSNERSIIANISVNVPSGNRKELKRGAQIMAQELTRAMASAR